MQIRSSKSLAKDVDSVDLEIGLIYTYEDHWMGPLLRTLRASAPALNTKVLLVDNASQRPIDCWREYFPRMNVIQNERRLGYAENLNRILRESQAKYVLLLNTDMVFDPAEQCLSKLVEFMDAHLCCGLSCPRLYRYDGSYGFPARRYPNWKTAIGRRVGESRFFKRNLSRYFYLDRNPYATMTCDWVTGCCMMVRREAVEAAGLLDEGFTKYFEDVDWCARMTGAGFDVMLCGDTYGFHAEQRASKKIISNDGFRHLKSYARWLWKYPTGAPPEADARYDEPRSHVVVPRRLPADGDFADDSDVNSVPRRQNAA